MGVKILNLIEVCPGKRHAWFQTDQGFRVRKRIDKNLKPIQSKAWYDISREKKEIVEPTRSEDSFFAPKKKKIGLFRRFINFILSIL